MKKVNVQEAIDEAKLSSLQIFLLSACTAIMLFDGLDMYMLGKLAPAVAESFGQPTSSMATVFFFQQIGLAAGAFLISPLADRYGRKPMLLWSTFAFGLLTLAAVWAQSIYQVAVLRGLAGLFLASIIPNVVALLTEYAPSRNRSTFVTIAFTGFSSGGAVASGIVIWLLDSHGWQSAFWIGGLTPLLLLPILNFCIPESIQFRVQRNPRDPSIGRTLARINPALALAPDAEFVSSARKSDDRKGRLIDVFTEGRGAVTAILWMVYFIALSSIALFTSFVPTFFYELGGVTLQAYAAVSLISLVVGLVGSSTIGTLMDRFRPIPVIAGLYFIDSILLVLMGWLPFGSAASLVVFAGWGYCKGAGQAGINAICAQVYPAKIRTTGVGWAFGIGRFGGIFAPLVGGLMLSASLSLVQVFIVLALMPLALTFLLLALGFVLARQQKAEEDADRLPLVGETKPA
ncbi:MFS transporter [Sphingosinicella sp. CPCC 101087]|uniref:MFS transporter n=1 Tax=Sphingosinicella sp. CPCC 101087 TaxID=2497754 RepID=UPI00101D2470|nr:MFS transporter [Sphingosinicella sp. CPCC 101087]